MVKRILLGLGGTAYTDIAIQRAVELAGIRGAVITGATVEDTKKLEQVGPVPPGSAMYAARLREQRLALSQERIDSAIDRFQTKCREAVIPARFERETGDPFETTMIAHARYNDMDLIFMGNCIRNLLLRHVLGDAVLSTIQLSDRPLFLAQ